MVKKDLVQALSELNYRKGQANVVIGDLFLVIAEALTRGEKVSIRGFGTFEIKMRKGHLVRDAHTKELRMMDDYPAVVFHPGENLKDAVKAGDPSKLVALGGAED